VLAPTTLSKGLVLCWRRRLLCREILVSGLLEFLAELRCCVPVNAARQVETSIQLSRSVFS